MIKSWTFLINKKRNVSVTKDNETRWPLNFSIFWNHVYSNTYQMKRVKLVLTIFFEFILNSELRLFIATIFAKQKKKKQTRNGHGSSTGSYFNFMALMLTHLLQIESRGRKLCLCCVVLCCCCCCSCSCSCSCSSTSRSS